MKHFVPEGDEQRRLLAMAETRSSKPDQIRAPDPGLQKIMSSDAGLAHDFEKLKQTVDQAEAEFKVAQLQLQKAEKEKRKAAKQPKEDAAGVAEGAAGAALAELPPLPPPADAPGASGAGETNDGGTDAEDNLDEPDPVDELDWACRGSRASPVHTTPAWLRAEIPGGGNLPGVALYWHPFEQHYRGYYPGGSPSGSCTRTWGRTTGRTEEEAKAMVLKYLWDNHGVLGGPVAQPAAKRRRVRAGPAAAAKPAAAKAKPKRQSFPPSAKPKPSRRRRLSSGAEGVEVAVVRKPGPVLKVALTLQAATEDYEHTCCVSLAA